MRLASTIMVMELMLIFLLRSGLQLSTNGRRGSTTAPQHVHIVVLVLNGRWWQYTATGRTSTTTATSTTAI
uniref:Putative secreted protein n=1 Tax=Anopheles triannulatus TaxID=58253 RepID=A0A2M4B455_9DIPT